MKRVFYLFSLVLLIVSIIFTILSYLEFDVKEKFPYVELLYLGMFVAFIPCIKIINSNKLKISKRSKGLIAILLIFCIYSFCTSFLNMIPTKIDNNYFLTNHGNVPIPITKYKYVEVRTENFIGQSAMWMLFYGVSTIIYYSNLKNQKLPLTQEE
jgi:hypothetical protein